jgi:PiT family inorganic phosphate transporter
VASPIVAGVAAMLATYLAYKITARARQDSVTTAPW